MARNRNGRADSATDNGSTTSGQSSLAQLSIRTSIPAIKDLTVAFLTDPKTPPSLKILCWAGAIGEIVVISLSVLLIGLGNPILGFSLAVLGILLIAVIIWVVFKLVSRGLIAIASQNPPSSPRPDPTWTRVVPMIPIKEVLLEQIHEKLENIRSLAYEKIEGFDVNAHTIKREYVRANIFLPDTGAVVTEGICELYIPKKLHVGMDPENDADRDRCERERNIRFKPNQGAAGVAFMETNTELARAVKIDTARYTWAEKYSLTESQKRAIHPELKWVISFPMTFNDGGNFRAMGVLNVDGLIRELAEDQLKILMGELSLKVMTISGLLAQNEKCRISLFVESM
jgi:hypothetical protein